MDPLNKKMMTKTWLLEHIEDLDEQNRLTAVRKVTEFMNSHSDGRRLKGDTSKNISHEMENV